MDDHSFVQLGPFEDDISDPLAILVQSLAHVYAAMTPNQNMQIATVILNQRCKRSRPEIAESNGTGEEDILFDVDIFAINY